MFNTTILMVMVAAAAFQMPSMPSCTVCHSKNPKMVRMHSALGFKDCFSCHGPAKELPVKERISERPADERCAKCHKS